MRVWYSTSTSAATCKRPGARQRAQLVLRMHSQTGDTPAW
jgi:hypothetical protein